MTGGGGGGGRPARGSSFTGRIRLTYPTPEGTATGIYGVILSAAVMATSPARSARAVVAAVLATLVVFWCAERYARLVAQRIHDGHRPNAYHLRHVLTTGWEMVTASVAPLAVLCTLSALGVGLGRAVTAALAGSALLLGLAGWEIGRHGQLSTPERLVSAVVAATFGVAMIALKVALH